MYTPWQHKASVCVCVCVSYSLRCGSEGPSFGFQHHVGLVPEADLDHRGSESARFSIHLNIISINPSIKSIIISHHYRCVCSMCTCTGRGFVVVRVTSLHWFNLSPWPPTWRVAYNTHTHTQTHTHTHTHILQINEYLSSTTLIDELVKL